jgi:hypothetical protein
MPASRAELGGFQGFGLDISGLIKDDSALLAFVGNAEAPQVVGMLLASREKETDGAVPQVKLGNPVVAVIDKVPQDVGLSKGIANVFVTDS